MEEIERVVLKYLMDRPPDFKWVFGTQVFDKKATIERFKKDAEFRKMIVENVIKLAVDLFTRQSE